MIEEHTADLGGHPQAWLSAPAVGGADGQAPVLYVHGVPTTAELWRPFLERTGGVALDLPGFGRSGKRGDRDFSVEGLANGIEALLDHLEIPRVRLVVQDWGGGAGLVWAQRDPSRVERLVLFNSVPLLPGYTWHRTARLWRMRGVGEVIQGLMHPAVWRRLAPMDERTVQLAWRGWDQGTQRAILHLYRAADPEVLEAAGARLGEITAPALVLWGARDPFIPPRFAAAYAEALGGEVTLELLDDAGHWPWIERPDAVEQAAAFLSA